MPITIFYYGSFKSREKNTLKIVCGKASYRSSTKLIFFTRQLLLLIKLRFRASVCIVILPYFRTFFKVLRSARVCRVNNVSATHINNREFVIWAFNPTRRFTPYRQIASTSSPATHCTNISILNFIVMLLRSVIHSVTLMQCVHYDINDVAHKEAQTVDTIM